jgi:hypothetical protein
MGTTHATYTLHTSSVTGRVMVESLHSMGYGNPEQTDSGMNQQNAAVSTDTICKSLMRAVESEPVSAQETR